MKAKAFLKCLCDKYNFRFFSGVPTEGFKGVFKLLNHDMLHYIPAANENIALALASGTSLLGINSVVMLDFEKIKDLDFTRNNLFKIPVLFLACCSNNDIKSNIVDTVLLSEEFEKDLDYIFNNYISNNKSCALCFKDGQLI